MTLHIGVGVWTGIRGECRTESPPVVRQPVAKISHDDRCASSFRFHPSGFLGRCVVTCGRSGGVARLTPLLQLVRNRRTVRVLRQCR